MKKSIVLIALLAIIFKSNAYVISSSNGYDVNIELTLNSLAVSSGCSGGWYNFGINYSYDISFTGNNAPSSMWTLQATSVGQDGSTFISLPNNGGIGSSTSSTVTRNYGDCATATPSSLGFDTIYLKIQGPGIPTQTIPLHVSALPVTLLHFTAKASAGQVLINWATASELNNDYFTVERSDDGVTFNTIATVVGAGTTNNVQHYESIDALPNYVAYYRLKQTDFDGTTTYSPIVVINVESNNNNDINIYPNPNVSGTVKVSLESDYRLCTIEVTNVNGQVVQQFVPTSQVVELEELPRGMYIVSITNQGTGNKSSMRLIQE